MINDWRGRFTSEGGEFPFFIVQLAGFMPVAAEPKESQWAELREAQFMAAERSATARSRPRSTWGTRRHPPEEQAGSGLPPVAGRVAIAYGKKVEYSGPVFKSGGEGEFGGDSFRSRGGRAGGRSEGVCDRGGG